jgi:predicted acylesterase/phospholipase RssA
LLEIPKSFVPANISLETSSRPHERKKVEDPGLAEDSFRSQSSFAESGASPDSTGIGASSDSTGIGASSGSLEIGASSSSLDSKAALVSIPSGTAPASGDAGVSSIKPGSALQPAAEQTTGVEPSAQIVSLDGTLPVADLRGTLLQQAAPLARHDQAERLLYAPGELGPGFPSASAGRTSLADKLHDWVATNDRFGLYNKAVGAVLDRVSETTERSVGIDIMGLLNVERTLYKSLANGSEGYKGDGQPAPLFQALASGQASYVSLGRERQSDADHMMLLFNGMTPEKLKSLEIADPELAKIRDLLLDKAGKKEFPVFVDTDASFDSMNPTESIATGCLASIAKRENSLGSDFPDPKQYYKWLLTRVHSNYAKLDPWLFASNKPMHERVVNIKESLTPPWLEPPVKGWFQKKPSENNDPFGAQPPSKQIQKAYRGMMEICGNGQPPTWETLTDVADAVINLDRDLLSGVQTYWVKLLSEVSPEQRETLMAPIARAWVKLNAIGPDHQEFDRVSPSSSPKIELVDRHTGKERIEQYDRAMALSQAVDHMINGLGITERKQFLDVLMAEIRAHQPELEAREARLREELGPDYAGLDIDGILNGNTTIRTPGVKESLDQLIAASKPELPTHEMTPEYAEITRHRDMLDWVATRYSRYGDSAFEWVMKSKNSAEFEKNPLIVSEYYTPGGRPATGVTPLPPGPGHGETLGDAIQGKPPLKMSVVLEGGGGKGFAYVDVLRQVNEALEAGPGQVQIDEFVGNSAGAITAGLLAAGYKGAELAQVLKELDFKTFYSDYLWLAGGVDPKARGISRTGLFSTQKMYQTLSELLKKKCAVEGRPVLFRDLPFKLKVTSTLLNGDISEDLRKQLTLAPDGQVVFSDSTTPNMDVAAALCCSAAIPGFFNSPQLQVCSGSDGDKARLSRMQMVDGGVVNNFPVAVASHEEKSFLVMLPASYEAPSPTPGGKPIALSTLNFDSADVAKIDAYNREQYKAFAPKLKQTLQSIGAKGYGRAVLGLNLAGLGDQTAPVVQGRSRAETMDLLAVSQREQMPVLDAETGAAKVKGNLQARPHGLGERLVLNELLDKDDVFKPVGLHPSFHPSHKEADGIADVLAGVVGASMTAPSQIEHRVFEA